VSSGCSTGTTSTVPKAGVYVPVYAGRRPQHCALYKYRPALYGAKLIDLGRNPFGRLGGARTDR